MKFIMYYYLIGAAVSIMFCWKYRFSKKRTSPKKIDCLLAIIGPWIFPLQIVKFIIDKYKNNKL